MFRPEARLIRRHCLHGTYPLVLAIAYRDCLDCGSSLHRTEIADYIEIAVAGIYDKHRLRNR